jgi:hypothetical protein
VGAAEGPYRIETPSRSDLKVDKQLNDGERMLSDLRREHAIRQTLRKLSRQRVALVLQPGNVCVIERAVKTTAETDTALKTCHMRGWVEPLESAIPQGNLTPDGRLPENLNFEAGPLYKLTSAGWSVIYRSNQLALVALVIALISLLVSIAKH